jgi:hypothetical protein
MPFSCKTSRKPPRNYVSLRRLTVANAKVTREMARLGLWSDGLCEVGVYLVPVSHYCYGWHQGTPGAISIPAVSLAYLDDRRNGRHTRLTDILRHEWAHALAAVHPDFVRCPQFIRTFGGEYDDKAGPWEFSPERHLTWYASTAPSEDFAETFHFYLRHKGRLPLRLTGRSILIRKWRYIDRMARRMALGRESF